MNHRVALIGCFHTVAKARALMPPGCALAALCDIDLPRLERCRAEDPSLFITDDYRQIANHPGIDSVVTYTPNETHRDIAVAMLESGKHVFIEKPMGIKLTEGRDILAAERRSGRHVAVDLETHVIGVGPAIKSVLDSGVIGEVLHIEFDHHRGNWLHHNSSGVYRTRRRTGGIMRMEGVHEMDLFRLFAGPIESVQAFTAPNALPHYEIPDNVTVMVWFASGARGRYTHNHCRSAFFGIGDDPRGPRFGHSKMWRITGSRGALDADLWNPGINVYEYRPYPAGTNSLTPHFVHRLDYSGLPDPMRWMGHDMDGCRRLFLERMATGLPPLQSAADAFEAEKVAWAAKLSSFEDGRRITIREMDAM